MDYREEIESFLPLCEQEKTDREVMLECCRLFGDRILERSCRLAHLTASSMIFNRERTKVLMAYHNIYDYWAWTGGHSDGERDGLKTAVKEAMEETGIRTVRVIREQVSALDILEVKRHRKRGCFVGAHLHLNLTYFLEADEEEPLHVCQGENSRVGWIPVSELEKYVTEAHMLPVYRRVIERACAM